MDIPTHYSKVSRGFWDILDSSLPKVTCDTLPFTADRYYESVHFSELALSLAPLPDRANHVNWYASAHIAAYIGIFDAAKHDVESLHNRVPFSDTPIYKELRATSETTDSQYKDPVNASRLYRALRNLRVHYGLPIVVMTPGNWSRKALIGTSACLMLLNTDFYTGPRVLANRNFVNITATFSRKQSWMCSGGC